MDLKIGSAFKALAILLGAYLGLSDAVTAQIAGALAILGAVGWDLFETFRLAKQGVVSTKAVENDPHTLAVVKAEEKAEEAAKP
jgi:hypothetical protein